MKLLRYGRFVGGCAITIRALRKGTMLIPQAEKPATWTVDDFTWPPSGRRIPRRFKQPPESLTGPANLDIKELQHSVRPSILLQHNVYTYTKLYRLLCDSSRSFAKSHQPRHYPMAFGRHLASRCETFKQSCTSKLEPPVAMPPAVESFRAMTYGLQDELYAFANLRAVFNYLRGGKKLWLPDEWQGLIPRSFPGGSTAA